MYFSGNRCCLNFWLNSSYKNCSNKKRIIWKHPYNMKNFTKFNWDWWWKKVCKKKFTDFSERNYIRYSRYTSKAGVFFEKLDRTIRHFPVPVYRLILPVFENGTRNWISEIKSVLERHNHKSILQLNYRQSRDISKRMRPMFIKIHVTKQIKQKPKFKLGSLVRTAYKKSIFLRKVIQQIGPTSCTLLQKLS